MVTQTNAIFLCHLRQTDLGRLRSTPSPVNSPNSRSFFRAWQPPAKQGQTNEHCLFLLLTTNPMLRRCFASDSDATSATAASRWILPNQQTAHFTSSATPRVHH